MSNPGPTKEEYDGLIYKLANPGKRTQESPKAPWGPGQEAGLVEKAVGPGQIEEKEKGGSGSLCQ